VLCLVDVGVSLSLRLWVGFELFIKFLCESSCMGWVYREGEDTEREGSYIAN